MHTYAKPLCCMHSGYTIKIDKLIDGRKNIDEIRSLFIDNY